MNTRLKYFTIVVAIMLTGSVMTPASYAQNSVLQTFTTDTSSGAFLGVRMTDVTEDNMSEYKLDSVQGVIIQSVEEGSAAEAAALKEKDIILEFDGIKVRSTIQFSRLVKETPVGREVKIVISRAGKLESVKARLKERDESLAGRIERMPTPFGEFRGDPGDSFLYRLPERNSAMIARRRPVLGVELQPLTDQLATYLGVPGKKGMLVSSVADESPSSGKLKAGDVIIRVEGSAVETGEDITGLLRDKAGDTITFKVIRDKKEITVKIDLPSEDGTRYRL